MTIDRSIDIEDAIREAIAPYLTIYCRPLPASFQLPCLLVTAAGGTQGERTLDTFTVSLQSRAEEESDAYAYLRTACALLLKIAEEQTTRIHYVRINSHGSWGSDPVRPDLALCEATLLISAHTEKLEV